MRLSIIGGTIVDPQRACLEKNDIHIANGNIVSLGKPPPSFYPEKTILINNCFIMPGIVDLSVRLREPGFEYKTSLESEMAAASAAGVTSLSCPPDTDPPLDEPGLVEMLKHRAQMLSQARLYPIGALTVGLNGIAITEMVELAEAGCVGFSQAGSAIVDTQILLNAMQYASTFNYTVWVRPQDFYLTRSAGIHQGDLSARLGLPGIPSIAETIEIKKICDLMRLSRCSVHLCRLSTKEGVDLVRQAKKEGLPITADVSIHHLHFIDEDIGFFNTNYKVDPPFRSFQDKEALCDGLLDGTLDAICSDHSPVDDHKKQLPFAHAESGVSAIELLLPLTLKWAKEFSVPLPIALAKITKNPFHILSQSEFGGKIQIGERADLCIFDPYELWHVDSSLLLSQGKNTPLLGKNLLGRVHYCLIAGKIVYTKSTF